MSLDMDIREEDLHAFIDDELGEAERKRIEGALTADSELAQRVDFFRADKARLLSLYGGGLNEPLPREWIVRIDGATARKPWPIQVRAIAALAASIVLILGGVIGFRQLGQVPRDDVVADALAVRAAQVEPDRGAVIRTAAEAEAQSAIMTRTLAVRVKAPDLSSMGYHLVAVESYSAPTQSFELRYVGGDGRIFTLYLRRADSPRFELLETKGLRVCVWQDNVIGIVMAGAMSAAEMERLAALAYSGLEGFT